MNVQAQMVNPADMDESIYPVGFAENVLGLELYPWQDQAVSALYYATGPNARRMNISVAAPNGSGKDDRIIPTSVHWWLSLHKRGKVVITTKSDLQLTQQTIPGIQRHCSKFGYAPAVYSPRYELTTPTGGKCIAFVTNLAARAEGWHKEDDINGPLLMIVNEAATVDDEIHSAIDRCTPNAVMLIGKPGLKRGRFWDTHSKLKASWKTIRAGLLDCPHIPKERIEYINATYGPDHPFTRSTLHGEFMEQDEVEKYVINESALRQLLDNPPKHVPGPKCAFLDFADGGAENTIAHRDGNKIELVDCWRDANKFASVSRFIMNFRKLGLKEHQIRGDAADKEMIELLKEAGWRIRSRNFGAKAFDDTVYVSWGAQAWRELSIGIEKREWILPNDDALIAQLITRQRAFGRAGKLGIEDKHEWKKRNVNVKGKDGNTYAASLDRADAVVGVAAERIVEDLPQKIDMSSWQGTLQFAESGMVLREVGASAGY